MLNREPIATFESLYPAVNFTRDAWLRGGVSAVRFR